MESVDQHTSTNLITRYTRLAAMEAEAERYWSERGEHE
jgi:hypothetical protein